MGAVTDRLSLGDDSQTIYELKLFVQVEHNQDDELLLQLWNEAKVTADAYLNNPFESVVNELVLRGNGTATSATLKHKPVLTGSEQLFLDGELMEPDSDYTINYTTGVITFTTAPALRSRVLANYEAELAIPETVKTWCLKRVARNYEFRIQGLTNLAESGVGSAAVNSIVTGADDFSEISMYRFFPGF